MGIVNSSFVQETLRAWGLRRWPAVLGALEVASSAGVAERHGCVCSVGRGIPILQFSPSSSGPCVSLPGSLRDLGPWASHSLWYPSTSPSARERRFAIWLNERTSISCQRALKSLPLPLVGRHPHFLIPASRNIIWNQPTSPFLLLSAS